jgi:hypothetical protein
MASDEYRRNAIECLRIADETVNARTRVLLIDMAQSWLHLAQQSEKNLTTDIVYETSPSARAPRDATAAANPAQETIG